MFDARDLLGRLLQSGLSGSTNERLGNAMGPSGLGQGGNPLSDILSQLSGLAGGSQGSAPQGSAPQGGFGQGGFGQSGFGQGGAGQGGFGQSGLSEALGQGGLGGLANMAESVLGQMTGGGRGGNSLAIGGLAALAGALLGGGRGASRGALGGGLMAILGSLAYSALQARAQSPQSGASAAVPPPVGLYEPSTPAEEQALDEAAAIVVQAMINAAKADGQVDATERARILGRLVEDGADAEAQAYVAAELSKPLATAALVEAVAGRPDLAIQVYGASLLAIDVDTPAETDYLRSLANALQLDAATVASLHEAFGVHQGAIAGASV